MVMTARRETQGMGRQVGKEKHPRCRVSLEISQYFFRIVLFTILYCQTRYIKVGFDEEHASSFSSSKWSEIISRPSTLFKGALGTVQRFLTSSNSPMNSPGHQCIAREGYKYNCILL